ncbi:hypothetical protein [Bacteroides sp. 519]|uniref:hypothetical protein n=1 Tax=Bacteroides sp. 519 TaxID=2302937 RepID=UPI0019402BDD|nr:hypothetical protein [Bacteroides sp. 519]
MSKEEILKEIEKVKTNISDYSRLADVIGATTEEKDRQINLMLEDLSKLLKELETID